MEHRCDTLAADSTSQLNVLCDRLDSIEDVCEETVEQVLERRLATLSEDLSLQADGLLERRRPIGSRRSERGHERGLRPSASLGRTATGHHGALLTSSRRGTPSQAHGRGDLGGDL